MKPLKYLALGITGALLSIASTQAANAADVYDGGGSLKDTAPVEYLPPAVWAGFYVGANLGATWDDTDDVDFADDALLTGGAHAGYNWQGSRNIVAGLEADIDFLDDVDYLSTLRGRLGYAYGNTLLYGTGGIAFIGFDEGVFGDDTDTGWAAGGGIEHMFTDNVSFGVEGLYYGFETDDDLDADFWSARARLTYHLGRRGDFLR